MPPPRRSFPSLTRLPEMFAMRLRSSAAAAACVAVALGGSGVGCRPDRPIASYTVAKETKPGTGTPTDAAERYRTLAAVLPADDKYSWFVKFAGPAEVVAANEAAFDQFVKSVKPSGSSNAPPAYAAPEGWAAVPPKPGQVRVVTVAKGSAEMYLSNPFGGSVLDNVNRWRKELGLRELKSDELAGATTAFPFGDRTGYRVDLRGPTYSGAMGGPRMGAGAGVPGGGK